MRPLKHATHDKGSYVAIGVSYMTPGFKGSYVAVQPKLVSPASSHVSGIQWYYTTHCS